jgi:hypothetical protein
VRRIAVIGHSILGVLASSMPDVVPIPCRMRSRSARHLGET